MAISEEVLNYKIIRQPYRITMAKWDLQSPKSGF